MEQGPLHPSPLTVNLFYFITAAPNPTSANAAISTALLTLLFTITFRSKTETETISNSPSTVSSADRTFWAQPPQSIPSTLKAITSDAGLHPIHSTTNVSNNTTEDIRTTHINITPLLSSDGSHDVQSGHPLHRLKLLTNHIYRTQALRTSYRRSDDALTPLMLTQLMQQRTRNITIGFHTIGRFHIGDARGARGTGLRRSTRPVGEHHRHGDQPT